MLFLFYDVFFVIILSILNVPPTIRFDLFLVAICTSWHCKCGVLYCYLICFCSGELQYFVLSYHNVCKCKIHLKELLIIYNSNSRCMIAYFIPRILALLKINLIYIREFLNIYFLNT